MIHLFSQFARPVVCALLFFPFSLRGQTPDSIRHHLLQAVEINQREKPSESSDRHLRTIEEVLNTQAASAYDLLLTLPGIRSDVEGNLSYRGSSKTALLINGQPTSLLGDYRNEILIQLPASAIAYIETDGNPSASLLGDGDAGVINIVLKQPSWHTQEGSVGLSAGNDERYGADFRYGLHRGITTLAVRGAYKKEFRDRSFQNYTLNHPGTPNQSIQEQNNTANARPQTFSGGIDASFDLTPHHQLSIGGSLFYLDFDRLGKIRNSVTAAGATSPTLTRLLRDNSQRQIGADGNLSYRYRFGANGEQLFASLAFRHALYDEDNEYVIVRMPENPNKSRDQLSVWQRANQYEASLGYLRPMSKEQQWEGGYNFRYNDGANHTLKTAPNAQNEWLPVVAGSYNAATVQAIHALYGQYGLKGIHWQVRVGLRIEETLQQLRLPEYTKNSDYLSVLPHVTLGYRFSHKHRVDLNYGRRINRPTTAELNPFKDTTDPLLIKKGNPALKAEESDNFSFGYTFSPRRFTATTALFYRIKSRAVGLLLQSDDTYQYANYGSREHLGAEASLRWQPAKWAEVSANGSAYRDQIDTRGSMQGSAKNEDWNFTASGALLFRLPWEMELQLLGIYQSQCLTPQGSYDAFYRINASVKQYFLQREFSVTLSADDLFDSAQEILRIQTATLHKTVTKSREPRRIWLGIAYQF